MVERVKKVTRPQSGWQVGSFGCERRAAVADPITEVSFSRLF
jgi:hypothetical protein